MARTFPQGFRWGTATAAHQVEGNNTNNDWWAWEHAEGTPCVEPSGDACDQLHRYPDDIRMLADLGFDNYRFSIEWARIEPEEGEFSLAALDHYRRVAAECLTNGIEPVVTFHHFTTPQWAANDGGWENPAIVERFVRYCDKATEHLGDLMGRACTINEPNIVGFMGYVMPLFPPGVSDLGRAMQVSEHFVAAHRAGYDAIKDRQPDLPTGLTLSMSDYQPVPADDEAAIAQCNDARRMMEDVFLEPLAGDDFVGVQTYSRSRFGPTGMVGPEDGVDVVSAMGYEVYPQALAATIRRAWDITGGVPVLVTENGLCTEHDSQRIEFVEAALGGVLDCIDDGIEVLGYTYWSLLDNFEWAFGYVPRFGLVEVDRATQRRTVKPSAEWLGAIARANSLG